MVLTSFGLKNVPSNVVLLIEEDIGDVKSVFFRKISSDALKLGKKVHYISTRSSEKDIIEELNIPATQDHKERLTVIGNFSDPISLLDMCYRRHKLCIRLYGEGAGPLHNIADADVCVIDMFSSLFIHEDVEVISETIEALIRISREANITFLLSADIGILPERAEKILRSMVDGVIQFRTEYAGGKINRYINIPKMKGSIPLNKMIAYNVTSQGITMDNRERVG
ncbi:RAD55 family ATPase [Methanolobus profundi]|uniref:RecA-superfamily ATPase, KaiC/GvpD/RAD55 family n=1 Tax=Methanolobus profundi TaxID=487685 RepID=A0A1I4PCX2_9EURY|nr:RAD55 family ATPase [Methanolobus profundi]SFM25581.1 RecA-superfamily ATPase, KaiC/GvpD/RAD55 family [Methanolobus profundi]